MWRHLTLADIRLGLVVRHSDGRSAFSDCVIIAIDEAHGEPTIHLARPYVYANSEFSSKQPLMGCEVFSVSSKRAAEKETDMLVSEEPAHYDRPARLDVRTQRAS
jgi:hypothetical protein